MTNLNEFIQNPIILSALALCIVVAYINYRSRRKKIIWIVSRKRLDDAMKVVTSRGYQVHYYIPRLGVDQDDKELVDAMIFLHKIGNIITDKDGKIVGKVAKYSMSSEEIAKLRRKELKVVS